MQTVTKAVLASLALIGTVAAVAPAANAQGYGYGLRGYGYADPNGPNPATNPYASDPSAVGCDYYNPPWGHPPNYCSYAIWPSPVYTGGIWYYGPIYYTNQNGVQVYWINGGWRPDEWRGPRPNNIDWTHNMRWSGGTLQGHVTPAPNSGDYAQTPYYAPQDNGYYNRGRQAYERRGNPNGYYRYR